MLRRYTGSYAIMGMSRCVHCERPHRHLQIPVTVAARSHRVKHGRDILAQFLKTNMITNDASCPPPLGWMVISSACKLFICQQTPSRQIRVWNWNDYKRAPGKDCQQVIFYVFKATIVGCRFTLLYVNFIGHVIIACKGKTRQNTQLSHIFSIFRYNFCY